MKSKVYTLSEMPDKTQVLNNGMTRIYISVEEKEEVLHSMTSEDGTEAAGESVTNKVYLCEAVDVPSLERSTIVSAIVRSRYSQDDVEAILANGNDEEHADEWAEFQAWRKKAKEIADEVSNYRSSRL